MTEDNSMSERILRTLEHIFNTDSELKEFSIIPASDNNRNKSPILYEHHHVAIESWCKKYILRHAYLDLFKVRKSLQQGKLSIEKMKDLNHLLIGALLLNPCVTTFWNMKRELILNEVLTPQTELVFAKMILSQHSKSNEAFAYRRWIVEKLVPNLCETELQYLLNNELSICECTAEKSQNNYHSWSYRTWCIEFITKKSSNFSNLILNELNFSAQWITRHVSEHTGYHFRQVLIESLNNKQHISSVFVVYYAYLIKCLNVSSNNDPAYVLTFLLGKSNIYQKVLEESVRYINLLSVLFYELFYTLEDLNSLHPDHESIWNYRKFIVFYMLKTAYEYHNIECILRIQIPKFDSRNSTDINIVDGDSKPNFFDKEDNMPKILKYQFDKVHSSHLYKILTEHERKYITKNSNTASLIQNMYAKRYEKWLCYLEGFLNQ